MIDIVVDFLFHPSSQQELLVTIFIGWLPFFVPLVYCVVRWTKLPRKALFLLTTCSLTIGLPIFVLIAVEPPIILGAHLFEEFLHSNGLIGTAPFTWLREITSAIQAYWWIGTIVGMPALTLAWSLAVSAKIGRHWSNIVSLRTLDIQTSARRAQ